MRRFDQSSGLDTVLCKNLEAQLLTLVQFWVDWQKCKEPNTCITNYTPLDWSVFTHERTHVYWVILDRCKDHLLPEAMLKDDGRGLVSEGQTFVHLHIAVVVGENDPLVLHPRPLLAHVPFQLHLGGTGQHHYVTYRHQQETTMSICITC